MLNSQHLFTSDFRIPLSHLHRHRHRHPSLHFTLNPLPTPRRRLCLCAAEVTTAPTEAAPYTLPSPQEPEGPIELFPTTSPVFATDDDPSEIQIATSVLLTGAISVFLFRSLRRRARRAKELQFRSSGVKKSLKEEALDSLKAVTSSSVDAKGPPSPIQAFLGAVAAGVIALLLYKFTTTIEASLNRQTISDTYSVRQITITVRTIINGLCYLATFVFGINAVGLFLYAGQLAIDSVIEEFSDGASKTSGKGKLGSKDSPVENPSNTADPSKESQSSDDPQ